jgi:hypothetical protein
MKNSLKANNKELSEDRKELIRILLAFVVMAIIFWFMLISLSVTESRESQLAAREAVCNNSDNSGGRSM